MRTSFLILSAFLRAGAAHAQSGFSSAEVSSGESVNGGRQFRRKRYDP